MRVNVLEYKLSLIDKAMNKRRQQLLMLPEHAAGFMYDTVDGYIPVFHGDLVKGLKIQSIAPSHYRVLSTDPKSGIVEFGSGEFASGNFQSVAPDGWWFFTDEIDRYQTYFSRGRAFKINGGYMIFTTGQMGHYFWRPSYLETKDYWHKSIKDIKRGRLK